MNIADFRNVAFAEGNVKIKGAADQQTVVASNGLQGRAVTWLKNAVGARTEKNTETINAFERALHAEGTFDHDAVSNLIMGLREQTRFGRSTLTTLQVRNALCKLGDKETLQRRNASENQKVMKAAEALGMNSLIVEYGTKLERNATALVGALNNATHWDEDMAQGSGPLRNMTTIMQANMGFLPRAAELKGHVEGDVNLLKELYATPVAGKAFSQWGTTGTFAASGQDFETVRAALLEHAEKILPVAQRLSAAVQTHLH